MADALREHLYAAHRERVVSIREFADMENAEIEDLWPSDLLADAITRYLRGPEEEFSEFYQPSKAHRATGQGLCCEARASTGGPWLEGRGRGACEGSPAQGAREDRGRAGRTLAQAVRSTATGAHE